MLRQAACIFMGALGYLAAGSGFAGVPVTPEVFAPGAISGPGSEDSLNLTPDGDTAIYDLSHGPNNFIVISHQVHGAWSKPEIAPFSGEWSDGDVALSPDGRYAVFVSNRPATPGGAPTNDASDALWRVDRKGDGWGEPWRLPDTVNPTAASDRSPTIATPSIAADGTLYFMRHGEDRLLHIFRAAYRGGGYGAAVQQVLGNPADPQLDPAIAPDQSFIVFESLPVGSKGPGRLFIAFREGGQWGKPADLGDAVNADNWPWGPHISPDGRTLYYVTSRSLPVSYPRSRAQAQQDLARLQGWDDGESNIWYVSLQPWLDTHMAKP